MGTALKKLKMCEETSDLNTDLVEPCQKRRYVILFRVLKILLEAAGLCNRLKYHVITPN